MTGCVGTAQVERTKLRSSLASVADLRAHNADYQQRIVSLDVPQLSGGGGKHACISLHKVGSECLGLSFIACGLLLGHRHRSLNGNVTGFLERRIVMLLCCLF